MSNYRFKDPTPVGKEFIVEKFNEEFSLNIDYKFFRKKLDHLKRKYKKYLGLIQNSTGISVDPVTFVITASDSWWKDREVCKVIKSFHRNPPEFWDIMQRCFRLYDVHSQSQYSVSQRREEMMNEGFADDEGYLNSEIYGEDTQVPRHKKMKRSTVLTLMINHVIHTSFHVNPCVKILPRLICPRIRLPEFHNKEESGMKALHTELLEAHKSYPGIVHEEVAESNHFRQL
ncbi:unnamed protein product [Microthlaspi erraticum]|uniref:Myb/SANT-like domain-containing protein n=1 Tax=Microthlaspi erraticum TaxID=1685480 RepID=A0A6D2JFU4_9BRAS|nr:unnamed protein product [Microthlaspi erraticum]